MIYLERKEEIERELGIKIDVHNIRKFSSLNELSNDITGQCERLSNPFFKECFLSYYVDEKDWSYLKAFVFGALMRGVPASEWLKGRVRVPDISLDDLLKEKLKEIYAELDVDYTCIVSPWGRPWRRSKVAGAFAKVESDSDYRSECPMGIINVSLQTAVLNVDPAKKIIWFRRWVAMRIASYLASKEALFEPSKFEMLYEELPYDNWSPDAVAALNGLKKEALLGQWNESSVPGYVGDDSLYSLDD
jgi:hypothetical protein